MITSSMIVAALRNVPEKHLKIIDLSWKFLNKDGTLDDDKLALNHKEINAAASEAIAYQNGNGRALHLLRILAGRR